MSRLFFSLILFLQVAALSAIEVKGNPFTKTFTPAEYGAHTRNFDIVCNKKGDVYVANFEGLLHYDHAQWHIYHTPNITRIVSLKVLPNDSIVAFDYKREAYIFVDGEMRPYSGKITAPLEEQLLGKRAYDGRGGLWTISEEGICYTTHNSPFSCFGQSDGLLGEVLSLLDVDGILYAGTMQGLFMLRYASSNDNADENTSRRFVPVGSMRLACWQLADLHDGSVLAATAMGVFRITDGIATRLTKENTISVTPDRQGGFYAGELEWVKHYPSLQGGSGNIICDIEDPSQIIIGKDGSLWVGSIYGEIVCRMNNSNSFTPMAGTKEAKVTGIGRLVEQDGEIYIDCHNTTFIWDRKQRKMRTQLLIEGDDEQYFTHFTYTSPEGITWASGQNGKGIYAFKHRKSCEEYDEWVTPLEQLSVRAMAMTHDYIAFGGNFGIYCIDRDSVAHRTKKPVVFIRSFNLKNDDAVFTYSTDRESMPGQTLYSYRLDDEDWSEFSPKTLVSLQNLDYGSYTLEVKCRDNFGIESDVLQMNFTVEHPFYLKWYAILFYTLLFMLAIYLFIKWRTARMRQEKLELEKLVQKRTKQLREAQGQLVRQEKLAMMGKLIQGIIDRILNPMNYILNFTKLTQELGRDLQQDIEMEKDRMSVDNYDDSIDIIKMITDNLVKIEEHGTSTTRILKAMETLLIDTKDNMQKTNISQLLKMCHDMTLNYFSEDIARMGMEVTLNMQPQIVEANVDGEKLSMALRSIIANAVYSLKRKYERAAYKPKLDMSLTNDTEQILITIRDNGTGIEENIIGKVFDPFFTTKPTAEATGVGLYITREIIHNHNGDITAESVKNKYAQFNITLPIS